MFTIEFGYRYAFAGDNSRYCKLLVYLRADGVNKIIYSLSMYCINTNDSLYNILSGSRAEIVDRTSSEPTSILCYLDLYIPSANYGVLELQHISGTDGGRYANFGRTTMNGVSEIPTSATTEFTMYKAADNIDLLHKNYIEPIYYVSSNSRSFDDRVDAIKYVIQNYINSKYKFAEFVIAYGSGFYYRYLHIGGYASNAAIIIEYFNSEQNVFTYNYSNENLALVNSPGATYQLSVSKSHYRIKAFNQYKGAFLLYFTSSHAGSYSLYLGLGFAAGSDRTALINLINPTPYAVTQPQGYTAGYNFEVTIGTGGYSDHTIYLVYLNGTGDGYLVIPEILDVT